MKLADKTALVTGGGTGIGLGIAIGLAREGCRVAIAGRRREKLAEAAAQYDGTPGLVYHPLDVAQRESVAELIGWANDQLGRIDILVNNAGTNVPRRSMAELDPADWQRMLDVNVTGAFHCMQAVLPQMRERRDGLIINISSIAGKRATLLGGVGYNASKFAMSALATSVALEYGKDGIRVTTIFPGEVETPILDARPVPVSAEHRARILQPEDLAAAAVMVASLHPRAHVPELVIKPTSYDFV